MLVIAFVGVGKLAWARVDQTTSVQHDERMVCLKLLLMELANEI
jgi:hypothetical protein